ncbi:MAG TPA: PIN/TRAM domain-containing protein [Planctomycetota bacterium]|nr:PIN/TRAM domain-containing protein [Planctomycetota bacterium]HRR81517.1 PIN/TRAM domain-containing protein [Planctomycetota bacterium]HRT92969.1 PIN/TRAM domain-containing protein [Planctomycetota bacterium]
MAFWALRAFFLLVCAGAGWQAARLAEFDTYWGILLGVTMFIIILVLEALFTGKEALADLLAVVFGITVGILLAILAINITTLMLPPQVADDPQAAQKTAAIRIILTAMLCYLCTMIIFRTRDRFRFVIPYVEFKMQRKGPRALLLDTSTLIDGRVIELSRTGVFESPLYIPGFVLEELQKVADSGDRLKRARGQRGLNLVNQLQRAREADISIYETPDGSDEPVDSRLIQLARELDAQICTTDANLSRVARAQGVKVLNLHELATALRPSVTRGEVLSVPLVRRGEEPKQAVGFLDDGTMIVVEDAADRIGREVTIEVVRYLQRSSGRIIFGRLVS